MSKIVIPTGIDVMRKIENTVVEHHIFYDIVYDKRDKVGGIRIILFPELQRIMKKLKYKYIQRKIKNNRLHKK